MGWGAAALKDHGAGRASRARPRKSPRRKLDRVLREGSFPSLPQQERNSDVRRDGAERQLLATVGRDRRRDLLLGALRRVSVVRGAAGQVGLRAQASWGHRGFRGRILEAAEPALQVVSAVRELCPESSTRPDALSSFKHPWPEHTGGFQLAACGRPDCRPDTPHRLSRLGPSAFDASRRRRWQPNDQPPSPSPLTCARPCYAIPAPPVRWRIAPPQPACALFVLSDYVARRTVADTPAQGTSPGPPGAMPIRRFPRGPLHATRHLAIRPQVTLAAACGALACLPSCGSSDKASPSQAPPAVAADAADEPAVETCNFVDDNGDGQSDEAFRWQLSRWTTLWSTRPFTIVNRAIRLPDGLPTSRTGTCA